MRSDVRDGFRFLLAMVAVGAVALFLLCLAFGFVL